MLRIMKLTVFLMLISFIGVFASETYSQTTKLSLKAEKITLEDFLIKIENQSEFRFFYTGKIDVTQEISGEFKNKKITEILDNIKEKAGIHYEVMGRQIILSPDNPESAIKSIQQQKSVSGTVTDENGQPLPGVTVIVKGTTNGTVTNMDGNYSISNIPEDATLAFSFVGMLKQEIEVGNQTTINVTLANDAIGIEEVVAIGYGVVKKSDLTGAVSSLKQEDFNDVATSVEDKMVGRIAGVRVIKSSSAPGGALTVQIRGAGSITAGNQPLYVIDGIPIETNQGEMGRGSAFAPTWTPRNPLSSIDPEDIENIDILKGASATAIYGSRAANGVVLITTKGGKDGKFELSYHGYVGIQALNQFSKLDVLEPEEYMRIVNDIIDAGGGSEAERVAEIQNGGTRWQDEIMQNGWVTNHNLALSGGNAQTTFYTSLGYRNETGALVNSGFERYSLRVNLDHKINKQFRTGINFTSTYNIHDIGASGQGGNEDAGALISAVLYDPTLSVYDDEGNYNRSPILILDNPVSIANEMSEKMIGFRTLGNIFAEFNVTPELKLKINAGADYQSRRKDSYITKRSLQGQRYGGVATINTLTNGNYLMEGTSTYNKDFEKFSLNILAGITRQVFSNRSFMGNASGFPIEVMTTNSIQSADIDTYDMSSSKNSNSLLSYFGRVNYNLLEKFLFTASFRADGSSRFGENNKFGYFPSAAFAWRLDQEDFIEENLSAFSSLKLRTSWGLTGNQDIGNYNSLTTFSRGSSYYFDDKVLTTYEPSRLANPSLKWETTEQINVGLDMGFISNRIFMTTDFYIKNTYDLLMNVPVPKETGYGSILENVGNIKNVGFEMLLSTVNTVGEFKWSSDLNFSTIRNEVTDLGDRDEIISGSVILKEGEPINSFYGYRIVGIWQEGDDFSSIDKPVVAGNLKYDDVNNDKALTGEDRVILGNSFPDFAWGLANNFSYKGFGLKIFIEGEHGASMLNSNLAQTYQPNTLRRNKLAEPLLNRWTPENPSNKYPSFVHPFTQGERNVNSYSVDNASYIKLRSVKLSYDLPFKKSSFVQNGMVYISADNLYTFTNYTGYDPSQNSANNPTLKEDLGGYPSTSTYILGIQLSF
jgi:TonB-linked SusC/RagA family outer membrane protein